MFDIKNKENHIFVDCFKESQFLLIPESTKGKKYEQTTADKCRWDESTIWIDKNRYFFLLLKIMMEITK